jgi:hypothetical protein
VSGGGVDYSTTEQDTGLKWIDGKNIYRRTFTGNLGNASTQIASVPNTVPLPMSNYIAGNSSVKIINTNPDLGSSSAATRLRFETPGNLWLDCTNRSGWSYIVNYYYTKIS